MPEPGQVAMMGAVLVLALLSLKDMQPVSAQKSKDIPAPKLTTFAGPTLRFLYCYS